MDPHSLPVGQDLAHDGAESRQRRIPVLLYFSQDHCGFCKRLEEEVLNPMMISGEYVDLVIMRALSIDPGEDVIGFDGRKTANRVLFHEYDGIVTPTIVLTDHAGGRIAKPLIGVNTVEFYGWYLDVAIEEATNKLRRSGT